MKKAIKNYGLVILFLSLVVFYPQCKKSEEKTVAANPTIESVDPVDGIIGDPVSIKGKNLDGADNITFNGKSSKIIQNTSTLITTVVPQGATAGTNNIAVHTTAGTSNEFPFKVVKEPEHVDAAPPSLTKVIPTTNYTDYPVLIYGDNLSGVIKISFNDKEAIIYTNNQKVITTTVPKDVPAGNVTIKVRTLKGTSTINFQVQGPPPGGPANVNFSSVNVPPPNYVPTISNNWSCGLFSEQSAAHDFVDLFTDDGNGNFDTEGRFEYNFNKTANYNNLNYVEFTNKKTGETFAGQFSSKFNDPCVLNMVLISSKTGKVSICTFDRRVDDPTLPCEHN